MDGHSPAMRRLGLTGLVCALAVTSGCASTPPAPSPESVERDVMDVDRRWWQAVTDGNVQGAVTRISDDAVFQAPDGTRVKGRAALGERLRRDSSDRSDLHGVPEQVTLRPEGLAVVTGTFEQSGAGPWGKARVSGQYVDTWRLGERGWRLVSSTATPSPPATKSGGGPAVADEEPNLSPGSGRTVPSAPEPNPGPGIIDL